MSDLKNLKASLLPSKSLLTKAYTFKMPVAVLDFLKIHAKETGTTPSKLIRAAVAHYLDTLPE